jgi:hypothetical protein
MTSLDRRSFLSAAVAAAGLHAASNRWTDWLLPQDPDGTAREQQLRQAVARAREQGKPLLVFVVPGPSEQEQAQVYPRTRWLGAFLNHGGPTALLEVALCVPACATIAELRKVTGAGPIDGLPLLLVVDAGAEAAAPKVTRLDLDLGSPFLPGKGRAFEPADVEQNRRHVEAGVTKLTTGLHETLHRHGLSLTVLAERVTLRLGDDDSRALAAWLERGEKVGDELLVRATAELRRRIVDLPDDARTTAQQRLCDAIEHEVVAKRVPGGRWHRDNGCGSDPEDMTPEERERGSMIACGMGMVPEHCERFLAFYTGP